MATQTPAENRVNPRPGAAVRLLRVLALVLSLVWVGEGEVHAQRVSLAVGEAEVLSVRGTVERIATQTPVSGGDPVLLAGAVLRAGEGIDVRF